MPFFKELRRRSRASFRTDKSSSASTNGTVPTTLSTSTLNSIRGSATPPSSAQHAPSLLSLQTPNSTSPALSRGSPANSQNRSSQLVHQKVLLIFGQIGDPTQLRLDGSLTVSHHQDCFPPTNWPVYESRFKALVYLTPGPNRLRFDFISPKLSINTTSNPAHSSWLIINMVPLTSAPPLHLAIVLARDSLGTFDAVPERIQREGNGLEIATRKFRMAAHLWQAFTGEQMYRNRFGRRCFRFEEEWQEGTLSYRDRENGQMRNEAKIHIIRTDKTLHEMRGIGLVEPRDKAKQKDELFGIALHAVKKHFKSIPGQKQYVSVLLIDSHWDKQTETITGHAAFGGGAEDIQLAIFGSHALQSYPSSIEEVIPAFSDCTRTDTNYVANDCSGSGSSWEAAIMSIGAHLRETGHLFSSPNQVSGLMLPDYVRLNRTFVCREPYSTRTKSPGLRLCLPKDECGWHRLACLRFRYHPCFRIPTDLPPNLDGSVQAWPIGNGSIMVTAPSGLAWIELHTSEEGCEAHIEYGNGNGQQRETLLVESDLRNRLPEDSRNKRLRLCIYSAGQGLRTIEDFSQFASKSSVLKLANGQLAFRGSKLGLSELEGTEQQEVILESSLQQTKLLVQIKVYHGRALEGIEFIYEDFTSQLFGKRGVKADESEFNLDTRRGEILMGFYVRADLWIDGVEILTSLGRRSGVLGNPTGGSG
ncbi:MAG: hypothetical protein M1840_007536 [Geoglossum simile]|nr:MAG: hypothetical protein M1840_007536 [Geoglossum simile]